ncbi:MAG: mannose-1-phosphate guanylyltransferase/mannose-6-phosphate isomerase [Gammaproteobacteria bacterium]|nr:mannose-1-phosphate guanylyltransferase/mannose-6-phosphate isomerase [Gammaproteobacteria bacterium]
MQLVPVILSGGAGTRLWPLSRELYPKQLLPLVGEQTLFQQTLLRLAGLPGVAAPLVVCNEEHRFLIAEQLRQLKSANGGILLEPEGRNTAPALTLAALEASREGADPLLLVMPADQVVQDVAAFQAAVQAARPAAAAGAIATFGIVPTTPHTGYGYIKRGQPRPDGSHGIERFVEKPDRHTAEAFLADGGYFWNGGLFLLRASVWLHALSQYAPAMLAACRAAHAGRTVDADFLRVDKAAFAACPSDSIDYAVMEHLPRGDGQIPGVVVPMAAGWSDLGAWSSVWEAHPADADGNVLRGDVIAQGAKNSLAFSESRLLALVGVENLVVVETADAVLVMHKDKAQDIKHVVQRLKEQNRPERSLHRRVFRPWGSYEGIDAGGRFQVKRIMVKPGASLSLQMHHHRAEHWVVVKGTAEVTHGEDVFLLSENESTFIPLGVKHRLKNPGAIDLEIIEVQSGSYLGEDDIVRFEDKYGRS